MALLIDMIILLLLVGTLAYAFLVDRRVRALMGAMQALEPMVDQFSSAVDRTETTVQSLRAATDRAHVRREDEPPLTRSAPPASTVTASSGTVKSKQAARTARSPEPADSQLPPGMARVSGKSDLVRSFFETIRSREA